MTANVLGLSKLFESWLLVLPESRAVLASMVVLRLSKQAMKLVVFLIVKKRYNAIWVTGSTRSPL